MWRWLAASLAWTPVAATALAFTGEDEATIGTRAVDFSRKSDTFGTVAIGGVDIKVVTSPPGSATYDRRMEAAADAGFNAAIGSRFGMRFDAKGEWRRRRKEEQEAPKAVVESTMTEAHPSIDLTYLTDKGLEIVAGIEELVTPSASETTTSPFGTSTARYRSAQVQAPHVGIVRRSGGLAGGFYYVAGAHAPRVINQSAFDGTTATFQETIYLPTRLGLVTSAKGNGGSFGLEVNFVQARSSGPRDDLGQATLSDYFLARLSGGIHLTSGLSLEAGVGYQALSYATSAYVTADTIPVTTGRLGVAMGDLRDRLTIGLIGSYGKDGQSLPDFNATYLYRAAALAIGWQATF